MAGGTGFSYARAILEYLIGSGSKRPVFLHWGYVRRTGSELEQMQQWARLRAADLHSRGAGAERLDRQDRAGAQGHHG